MHGSSKHSCNSQMLAPDKSYVSYAVVVRLVLEARYWTITYTFLIDCFKPATYVAICPSVHPS